jgi:uncharacterized protein YecE (DUF72 family)
LQIYVGEASLRGAIAKYAREMDLVEISGEAGKHPRKAGLVEWRRTVRKGFAFSVVVPSALASLEAQEAAAGPLLAHAREVADALAASFWVLRTPPSVTPAPRSMRGLASLVRGLGEGRRVAWEPRGVWSAEAALEAARALGIHLVQDLAQEVRVGEATVVYTRLRALGEGTRVGANLAERVAERLEGAAEAYVVVEGEGARGARRILREMLGGSSPRTAADDDDSSDDADSSDDDSSDDDDSDDDDSDDDLEGEEDDRS